MSKKVIMLIGTIIGDCLVLILCHFWPDIPSDVVQWVVGGISGTGVGGLLGQEQEQPGLHEPSHPSPPRAAGTAIVVCLMPVAHILTFP